MSKTIDLLKQAHNKRISNYPGGIALHNPSEAQVKAHNPDFLKQSKGQAKSNFSLQLILVLAILAILGFNIQIFIMLKNYSQDNTRKYRQISEVRDSLDTNNKSIELLSTDMKGLKSDIEKLDSSFSKTNKMLKELNSEKDSQQSAIDNLIKAKNTLFNRINALESKLEELNTGIQSGNNESVLSH